MKVNKIFISFSVALFLFACSKKESSSVPDHQSVAVTKTEEKLPEVDSAADITEGKALIEGADCMTCHQISEKMIGPSYMDVAGKYENTPENAALLAGKIIEGGSGVWGSVPMAAHPGMSRDNVNKMVAYILSLRK
ncbi:c-type cytochrome [Chryseobacterium sp.]|uniref:c-type cytochrome n=1 Tax=Chryseobacterium sp. TaxID=1871047 RepID=UPI0011C77CA2|nr:c-type cytochrome [Chryseobacterium sp.]TXF79126.1 c-type cytochrome [Chryseobacterium sp.]